ncbi:hypothetical protein KBZ21_44935, partial [Streptomyces sp. A73]|nr:hypothetical protein [Streptomyces sp. A73]
PGSCQDILDGGKPVPVEPLDDSHVVAVVPVEERDGVARQAVESASIAVTDGLTAKQIRALSDQVVAKLKERGIL